MDNVSSYKVGLSTIGGLVFGLFGLITGTAWQQALQRQNSSLKWKLAGIAALWGMTVVQLTPTGGVIMENKTTVNYSVITPTGGLRGPGYVSRTASRSVG